jgi:hypothetical protein
MKELAVYFKKRMKDQETIPKLWADRNYGEEVEYNIDHEIENRKIKLLACLNNLKNNNNITNNKNQNQIALQNFEGQNNLNNNIDGNANNLTINDNCENNNNFSENNFELKTEKTENLTKDPLSQEKLVEFELKLLKAYNFQKKLRRDVVMNFINEFDKHNTVYYSDVLFHKTLLDRRFYKKQAANHLVKKETRLSDKFEQQLRVGIDFRKRDKHLEFLNSLMQHHKDFMEFHKVKRVIKCFFKFENFLIKKIK